MSKRLMMLGGSLQQVCAIQAAREMGCYVILCDYLSDNPGRKYADEWYDVSTTDEVAVLGLAERVGIDGIVAYASDPAAPTAAYVAEKLGLPGCPYESVQILTQKDMFRSFLTEHGFNAPKAMGFGTREEAVGSIGGFRLPVMVKPVDSSGSKGVVKVDDLRYLPAALDEAFSYSRCGRVVIEEFIVKKGYQVSGDGFSVDGRLAFTSYGNELYSGRGTREYVALGEFWPSLLTQAQREKVDSELQRLITALGMRTTAYNIEVILDENDDVYVLELGPRSGGSYIPQLIRYATGVDLIPYVIKGALGEDCSDLGRAETRGFWSNYMILSTRSGRFERLRFDPTFERENLLEVHCTARPGDEVHAYQNTTHSLGTLLFKARDLDEMERITSNPERYFEVVVS